MLKIRDLKIWQKLTLIIVLAGLTIPFVTYLLLSDRLAKIDAARQEQTGIAYLKAVKPILEKMPQHRGTANTYLNGNTAVKDRLTNIGDQLDTAFRDLETLDKQTGTTLKSTQKFSSIYQTWRTLRAQVLTLPALESFNRHTKLIADIIELISSVGDSSGLRLDQDFAISYSAQLLVRELPNTTESLGQMRGFGSGIAARKAISQDEFGRLSAIIEQVKSNTLSYQASLRSASQNNPDVERALGSKFREATEKINAYVDLTTNRLLKAQTIDINSVEYFDTGTRTIDTLFAVYDDQLAFTDNFLNTRTAALQRSTYLIAFGVILAIALSIFIAIYVARVIADQLKLVTNVVEEIEKENLEARAQVINSDELGQVAGSVNKMLDNIVNLVRTREKERDELENALIKLLMEIRDVGQGDLTVNAIVDEGPTGAIADSFNYTLAELRQLITRINEVAANVGNTTSDIKNTTSQLAQGSETQTQKILGITNALTDMARSINRVSEEAAVSTNVAEQSLQKAKMGMDAVGKTIEGMNGIREQVQKTSKRIKRLGESSQEIGEIVQLIGEITNQTSILALNASIQAAMAGEAGRGFAVVAEEVERLAERSSEATKRIGNLIKTIQTETNEAVSAMEDTTHEVVKGSSVANEAGQALSEIQTVSNQLAEIIKEISETSKKQAKTSEELAKAMDTVSAITVETSNGTKQVVSSIDNLNTLTENLKASVSTFKVSKNELNGNGKAHAATM
ncbi:MAG: methyl-accepting chemotaxis protein [Blastocatellia bacterium]|nr:methyl-accepting chemotaxis protein [Blastocatellia bacterium]